MFMAACFTAALPESKELLAAAVTRPRTSAVIVAISPIPTFTVSLDSASRWSLGKVERSHMPTSTPPNTQAKTVRLATRGLTLGPRYDESLLLRPRQDGQ